MNKRIREAVLALLVGVAVPGIAGAALIALPPEAGSDTCDDEVAAAKAALEQEIYQECNGDMASPTYDCRVYDTQQLIKDTEARCAEDLESCGIDIQDQIDAALEQQKADFTAACEAAVLFDDVTCPVLDVQAVMDAVEAVTKDDCFKNPDHCGISISSILDSAKFGETEPNDHIVSADILAAGVPLVGQMYGGADEDWFLVTTVENNSIIEIWFKETSNIWHVELLDSAGNRLSAADTPGDPNVEFRFDTSVTKAGKYYVVVSNVGEESVDSLYQIAAFIKTTGNSTLEPDYNFHDVETEPNGLFTNADPLSSNVVTYGQILHPDDYDVYHFDSAGNEILHMELCYQNTTCNASREGWAMFLVSAQLEGTWPCAAKPGDTTVVDNCFFTEPLTTYWYDKSYSASYIQDPTCTPEDCKGTGEVAGENCTVVTCQKVKQDVPGSVAFTSDHLYYLMEYGRFDSILIGKIDPKWGEQTGIDVSLEKPGVYYVIVTPTLRDDGSGNVVIKDETIQYAPDTYKPLVVDPYISDQYTFRVTRTALEPSMAALASKYRAKLDVNTGLLSIPEVEFANDIYKMNLQIMDYGVFNVQNVTPVENPGALP